MEEVQERRRSLTEDSTTGLGDPFAHPSNQHLQAHASPLGISRFSEGETAQQPTSPGYVSQSPEVTNEEKSPSLPETEAPETPFWKQKWFLIANAILLPFAIGFLFIVLYPVITAIVQMVVNRSTLNIEVAAISDPRNTSFTLEMKGFVAHTGVFDARIDFPEPVNVYWTNPNGDELHLGTMALDRVWGRNSRAALDQKTTFNIVNEDAFGSFTQHMIVSEEFTWRLRTGNLAVQAVKFPTSHGIAFDKELTLKGMNSFFGNVKLKELQLPGDDPEKGIQFISTTEINNPSPFSLNLGTVEFMLYYKDVALGVGTGLNTVILPGAGNDITLEGFLQKQDGSANLAVVSELFTQYLNGEESPVIAKGLSTKQEDGTEVKWLSEGLKALTLQVPFKTPGPISPIRSITIGDFALAFQPETAWSPSAESRTVQATMELPFGFNVAIDQIQNNFIISKDDQAVAGLATPLGASTSEVKVYGPTDTRGTINITIADTKLDCPDPSHPVFSRFNANLTSQDLAEFRLIGNSSAVANTSIGSITLNPIKIDLPTSLLGLQGLQDMVTINEVDVTGGTAEGIDLAINVSIQNPSNLQLATGDLTLQLFRDSAVLGTALMPNLTLNMGSNDVAATSSFQANESPEGLQTLTDFVGGTDVALRIAGYDGSTEVASLLEAFKTLDLNVQLPALNTKLLDGAALQVLPTTGTENNLTYVTVDMANPFSTDLSITSISSTITSYGLTLGMIETVTDDFHPQAKSTTTSPDLALMLNFDPATLLTVTRNLAVDAGMDTTPLDGIVQLGGYSYLMDYGGSSSKKRQSENIYSGFNLPDFVDAAFAGLHSDVVLRAGVTIGDYQTSLEYSQLAVATKTDESLHYILPVLAKPIVEKIVSGSGLSIDTVLISDPSQSSFRAALKGGISDAGPFDATISFPDGLTVSWGGSPIGTIQMDDVAVAGDVGATLDTASTFSVADVSHLTEFSKALLSDESFDWEISGENLVVSALGIEVSGIPFPAKKVSLKGFNGLKDGVTIKSFDLPSNDEAGGIHLTLEVDTKNPSQVGMELSALGFANYAQNQYIGPAGADSSLTLSPQSTTSMSLSGRLVPQDSSEGLDAVSMLFNNFIHGQDSDVVVRGDYAGPSDVTWLNDAIKVLRIETKLPNQGALDIMRSIAINEMTLMFSEGTAYNPDTSSKSTDAAFDLPFAFPVDIVALESNIDLGYNGNTIARLSLPHTETTTDVQNRVIHMPFQNAVLRAYDDKRGAYGTFLADVTVSQGQPISLASSDASVQASTAVGVLGLRDIRFNVGSSIEGLQALNVRPITVSNLDVNRGFPDYLLIKVDGAIYNPSNLTIGAEEVSMDLSYLGQNMGSTILNDLVIAPGNHSYPIDVHFSPQGGAQGAGRQLLENFISGIDIDTSITGSTGSTPIDSLKQAFSRLNFSPVTIPAMQQTLIESTTIVFPTNIVQTGIAQVSFILVNPFTASLNLLQIAADATYKGMHLARINDLDISSHPLHADGHSSVTSPFLPLVFNMEATTIIPLLSSLAAEGNVDLGPVTTLFEFLLHNPGFNPPVTTSVDTEGHSCHSGNQFDVAGAILQALAGLEVDLSVETGTKIDEFPATLSIVQKAVPAHTDETALYLIGAIAGPVAQYLVSGSTLEFQEANITSITNEGFDLSLAGSLTNAGPLDALITFTEPVDVTWDGHHIATIALEPLCISANDGLPDYRTNAHLTITDQGEFTNFAIHLLHNPDFTWTISTSKLRLNALGTVFDNVALSKEVSFKGFDDLPGVLISNFQLPSDDPEGGIHVETDALIPSLSNLGIDLGTVGFETFFKGATVGPLSSESLVLAPLSEARTHLSGRIVPQGEADLGTMGELFTGFLQGNNQTLVARGVSVQPPGSSEPVGWLSTAFQTLSLDVILPGEKYDVIHSISLNDLQVTMNDPAHTWAPPTSSEATLAKYQNPFGFSLQVVKAAQTITLGLGSVSIARLDLPLEDAIGGISTGDVVDLPISFHDVPLEALNNAAFAAMLNAVTNTPTLHVHLQGSASVFARTPIGDVPISDIPFDVESELKGMNGFGHTALATDVTVSGSGGEGGNEYIVSPLTTTLNNPSNITLHTDNVALPVVFSGIGIGRAVFESFDLLPGEVGFDTEFRYMPSDQNDTTAQAFITEFITTGNDIPLVIDGDSQSSPYASLSAALDNLQIATAITGLNEPDLVTHIAVEITLMSLITNKVDLHFDLYNPLDVPMVINQVQADGYVDGIRYATFTQPFSDFVVPPKSTANSGKFPDVLLVQGAEASLGIIGRNLDIRTATTVQIGAGGYQLPWLKLDQDGVPTTYTISALRGASPEEALKPLSSSSVAATSSSSSSSTSTTVTDTVVTTTEMSSSPPSSPSSSPEPTTDDSDLQEEDDESAPSNSPADEPEEESSSTDEETEVTESTESSDDSEASAVDSLP